MCPNGKNRYRRTNALECSDEDEEQEVYHFINSNHSCYEVNVQVEGKDFSMQIDTGAAVTIVSESVYESLFQHIKCEPSKMSVRTYTGEQMRLKGQYQRVTLPLIVVKDNGRKLPVLLGRNWLESLKLDWPEIVPVASEERV